VIAGALFPLCIAFFFFLIFNISLTMCGLGLFLYFACSVEVFNLVFDCVYLMIFRLIVDLGSRRKRFAQKIEE